MLLFSEYFPNILYSFISLTNHNFKVIGESSIPNFDINDYTIDVYTVPNSDITHFIVLLLWFILFIEYF